MEDSSNSTHSIMNFILADCASSSEAEVEVKLEAAVVWQLADQTHQPRAV